jgi:hypothetical protein
MKLLTQCIFSSQTRFSSGSVLFNMVTTRAGYAKKRAAELPASARLYQHPPSYDHYVNNIGLSFEELKQRHIEQALQQCQDRNSPLTKAMIDMIENPSPPFESSDDDETTNNVLI